MILTLLLMLDILVYNSFKCTKRLTQLGPGGAPMYQTMRFRDLYTKKYLSHVLASVAFAVTLFQTHNAFALLINIDFDQSIAARRPSDGFGAASGQAGVWNQIRRGSTSNLLDINGNVTTADISVSALSSAGQAFFPTNDAQRLLNDNFFSSVSSVPSDWFVTITEIQNQVYDLYLYAPTNSLVSTGLMTAMGTSLPELLGNDLGLLVKGESWIRTQVDVIDGTLSISGTPDGASRGFAGLAGLQLMPVPEPETSILIGLGLATLVYWRRRTSTKDRGLVFPRKSPAGFP
jgi:hypothetical protein